MKPRSRVTKLIHDLRLNTAVQDSLRKTAHDLFDSDVILLSREQLWEILSDQCEIDSQTIRKIEAALWK